MPLVTFLAKGKSWSDEEFAAELAGWDVKFYAAEAAVLRPLIEGDGLIQLMQKHACRARPGAARQAGQRPPCLNATT
ncbi:hypothetical protein ACFSTJ_02175 [Ottowia pentelensis]|uniref:hypothetical protein n=1 Tax=Ottowia pentelensis TaxID=511108 RepID=UPI00362FDD84